jgi:hypothetical protein
VEKGVDFRFAEVGTVVHGVMRESLLRRGARTVTHEKGSGRSGGATEKAKMPFASKPRTLSVNYRSHAGVMDLAASVLERMFDVFQHAQDDPLPRDTCLVAW